MMRRPILKVGDTNESVYDVSVVTTNPNGSYETEVDFETVIFMLNSKRVSVRGTEIEVEYSLTKDNGKIEFHGKRI